MIYIVGAGNAGGHIATMLSQKVEYSIPLIFSTSAEDTTNMKDMVSSEIIQIINEGNGKNFQIGERLWNKKEVKDKLENYFSPITEDDKVIYCISLGGGSGSSSVSTVVNILNKRTKNIGIVAIMPHEKTVNFVVNYYLSLNALTELSNKFAISLFDNATLLEKFKNNIEEVNHEIVNQTIHRFLLKEADNRNLKSVWAIDQRDYDEIVFKAGFVNSSITKELSNSKVKFDIYGNLRRIKRMDVVYNIKESTKDSKVEELSQEFQKNVQNFTSKFGKNVITTYGVVRSDFLEDNTYYVIGNGFEIMPLLVSLQNKAQIHMQKLKSIKDEGAIVDKQEKKDFSFENL